jgi:hypothetical protein
MARTEEFVRSLYSPSIISPFDEPIGVIGVIEDPLRKAMGRIGVPKTPYVMNEDSVWVSGQIIGDQRAKEALPVSPSTEKKTFG